MGMAQDSSDVDAVLYLKGQDSCGGDFESCDFARDVAARIKELLADRHGFQAIDFINLDIVEKSINAGNAACDQTQRFAVYRSFCRPVNYRLLAPGGRPAEQKHSIPDAGRGEHEVLPPRPCGVL